MDSYMVCLKGGIISPFTDGQRIEELMEKHQELFEVKGVSDEYFEFLKAYEALGDSWSHAHKPGDGTITIAFGVVIQDKNGKIVNQELYNKWLNQTMTEEEAKQVTRGDMQPYVDQINEMAKEKGWHLTQNRYDAIFDLAWNAGTGSLQYNATELLATGDLTNEAVVTELRKEILETALMPMDEKTRKVWEEKQKLEKKEEEVDSMWAKVLVERRLDTVRIAQGDKEAYDRHSYDNQWWSENNNEQVRKLFQKCEVEAVNKYPFQELD